MVTQGSLNWPLSLSLSASYVSWSFFLLVTKNFLVKVQLSKAAIFSCRLTARMLGKRDKNKGLATPRPLLACTPVARSVLFVAVEVVDGRFELDGLDHFPRAERIQVGAAVRRVGSARTNILVKKTPRKQ